MPRTETEKEMVKRLNALGWLHDNAKTSVQKAIFKMVLHFFPLESVHKKQESGEEVVD